MIARMRNILQQVRLQPMLMINLLFESSLHLKEITVRAVRLLLKKICREKIKKNLLIKSVELTASKSFSARKSSELEDLAKSLRQISSPPPQSLRRPILLSQAFFIGWEVIELQVYE